LTRGAVRRLIQQAETAASVLRTRGHRFHGDGERKAIADLLETLAYVARKRLDPEHEPANDVDHSGEQVTTDLFAATEEAPCDRP
jgi:hypothetical protein